MIKRLIWVGVMLSLLGFIPVATAGADDWDKKTVLTFSQPVEIPGRVLPAGTYTFRLVEVLSDRHIVQIFSADGTTFIATVMTIPNYRLKATDETVIRFREVPAGTPQAIRAWFYPGDTTGQEFVYPKMRAVQLAKLSNAVLPAIAVESADATDFKTASIVAVTPEAKEVAVTTAFAPDAPRVDQIASRVAAQELPATASAMPFIALFGFAAMGLALGLFAIGRRTSISVR